MKTVRDIPLLENVPVLVRASLNEPVVDGKVADTFRLSRAASTISFLQARRARVVVISHIGEAGTETLAPVASALSAFVKNVSFCPESIGPVARDAIRKTSPSEVVVLENLRRNRGETGNDSAFAKELAQLGDVFVEDSFDTCHRKHASIVTLPTLLPCYAGLVLEEEVRQLSFALAPSRPSLAIIGGAKFSTKEPVLMQLLEKYDKLFIGGALANDFLAGEGHNIGASLAAPDNSGKIAALLANPKLVLPIDSRVAFPGSPRTLARVATLDDVRPSEAMLDHGPATEALLSQLVTNAKTVLWNGPLGNYENGFVDTTDELAKAIATSSAYSIVGGGDTITAIEKLGVLKHFSFVSTGGGAMLDFLANGTLPGIAVLG